MGPERWGKTIGWIGYPSTLTYPCVQYVKNYALLSYKEEEFWSIRCLNVFNFIKIVLFISNAIEWLYPIANKQSKCRRTLYVYCVRVNRVWFWLLSNTVRLETTRGRKSPFRECFLIGGSYSRSVRSSSILVIYWSTARSLQKAEIVHNLQNSSLT